LDLPYLRRVAARVMHALGLEEQEASIIIVSDRRMASLNLEFRGKAGPTDVLSFGETGLEGYQGDVFISAETAARQARKAGHLLRRESAILLLHGLLHLAGYDHETDHGEMRRLERKMRRDPLFLD
jgi:probable rRNA maturation factor